MPVTPPEWLLRHARQISSVLIPLARAPLVTALLERWRPATRPKYLTDELSFDESEKLMLCLYWVSEYQDKRISPAELLYTLAHITSNLLKE
jgi:hypothetical protein